MPLNRNRYAYLRLSLLYLLSPFFALLSELQAETASVKALGMGGAGLAYPFDALSAVDNPANAVDVGYRFDLGGIWLNRKKELTISERPSEEFIPLMEGSFSPGRENQVLPVGGVNFLWNETIALGAAWSNVFTLRTNYGTRLNDFSEFDFYTFEPIGPNARLHYVVDRLTLTTAFCLNPWHSLGVSLNVDFANFRVDGILGLVELLTPIPQDFSDAGDDHAAGLGVTVGWTGRLTSFLTGALSYSSKTWMQKMSLYTSLVGDRALAVPQTLRMGVLAEALPCLLFAIDGEYRNYGGIKGLSRPFNEDSTQGFEPPSGFNWRDQWALKMGALWQLNACWELRAGYRWESGLFDKKSRLSTLNSLTLLTQTQTVSCGFSWKATACSELSFFGEYVFPRSVTSRIPSVTNEEAMAIILFPARLKFNAQSYRLGLSYGLMF